ncbi:MAG: hypothetical protein SCK70_01075, partial [bacterium]|nr:hypothetical protein [bacterium]
IFSISDPSEIDQQNYLSNGHGDDIVCVITDMYFPIDNKLSIKAGQAIVELIKKYFPRIPILIASKAEEGNHYKNFAFVIPKGDSGSLQALHEYIHDYTGMGDFIIRDEKGAIRYRVSNIHQLLKLIIEAEDNSLESKQLRKLLEKYGRKEYFSTWLYMHGFRDLGDELRPKRATGKKMLNILKQAITAEIERTQKSPLIINGNRIFSLEDLLKLLRTIEPDKIQFLSDNDIFSYWLDRKGFPELAEEFRPIHGTGYELTKSLADLVEKWIPIYRKRSQQSNK